MLPYVEVKTFHVSKNYVLEFDRELTQMKNASQGWKQEVGLAGLGEDESAKVEDELIFMLIPLPAFQANLDDFLRGLQFDFPQGQTFGGIAFTVSLLSRARIFDYFAKSAGGNEGGGGASLVPDNGVYRDGCVGVALKGDIRIDTMVAQNAEPGRQRRPHAKLMAEYAKAHISKPPLAEANFVMKALSDDDQALMRGALLIGLERRGGVGSTPKKLARLAKGEGHCFTVRQVASAGEVVKTLEIQQRDDFLLQQF